MARMFVSDANEDHSGPGWDMREVRVSHSVAASDVDEKSSRLHIHPDDSEEEIKEALLATLPSAFKD